MHPAVSEHTCSQQLLDPKFTGEITKRSVIELLGDRSARELSETSEQCACKKGCKYKKYVDCDELWWPKCAESWYEPGEAPTRPGKPPKDKKSWKNAFLALRPEDGPTPEEVARREAKVAKREALLEKWKEENLAGGGSLRGRAAGVGDVVAPVDLSDKEAMRAFYKSVANLLNNEGVLRVDMNHVEPETVRTEDPPV